MSALIFASLAVVLVTVVMALGLVHRGEGRASWLLIVVALVLMLLFRLRALMLWTQDGVGDPVEGVLLLLVSLAMAVAVCLLARAARRTAHLAAAMHAAQDQADQAKANFLANMSHELRTPLNAVIGFAQVMRNEYLGPLGSARYREYAAGIEESGQHLLEMVEDVLDVARIEAGQLRLRDEVLDPARIMDSVARLARPKADGAKIMLYHEPGQALPPIRADARRLRQVLLNLVSNAIKFTPAGGLVEIRGETMADGGFCFVVRDTGIGIQPTDLERVMALFGQAENIYNRSHSGPGLGLPIAHGLMELHGGGLLLDSAPDHGTTIRATLPPARVVPAAAAETSL